MNGKCSDYNVSSYPVTNSIYRMTYHFGPPNGHQCGIMMMPHFVLFVDPSSKRSFELMFVEVKRKGSNSNGHHESEVVKIGKEMQVAINKLIFQKVENPEVVGLLVEGKFILLSYS